jgi:hypothetical protein
LLTPLITSFHHSVRFGDLAIPGVTGQCSDDDFEDSNVDYDDEKNNENDGNDGNDDDEFLSAWTCHGQNWSHIC